MANRFWNHVSRLASRQRIVTPTINGNNDGIEDGFAAVAAEIDLAAADLASTDAGKGVDLVGGAVKAADLASSEPGKGAAMVANVVAKDSSAGAADLPVGTTAQRPTGANGKVRYNSDLNGFEGYANGNWGSLGGGGATGAGSDKVFMENDQTVTGSYTLTAGKNAVSAGPITVADGVVVTVPSGATWSIV